MRYDREDFDRARHFPHSSDCGNHWKYSFCDSFTVPLKEWKKSREIGMEGTEAEGGVSVMNREVYRANTRKITIMAVLAVAEPPFFIC